ncbi:hypothetical protein KFL_001220080 [Klebsormidium nitens]|uniref:Uncharacterized protein n=1 Tax=Klebsormidium nitens TaxID=105231 RepID=A0A1Y1HVT3_KLENI|nr:hypothetical protein KFL_001220080 [Klebsormidium nitens]|eukprot:GAQ82740.1 hypothetical protein KFL_001220080 [Klebsormidium nitens]
MASKIALRALPALVCLIFVTYLPRNTVARVLLQQATNSSLALGGPASEGIQGYLLVIDGETQGQVTVLDLASGSVNDTLQLADSYASGFTTSSGRYAIFLQYDGNLTSVYDSNYEIGFDQGAWSIEQTATPGLSDFALDVTSPSNFATLGPITAIFFDEEGRACIIDERQLGNASYSPTFIKSDRQHGFVAPLSEDFFAIGYVNQSAINDEEVALAQGVQVYNTDGTVVYNRSRTACPELHGTATNGKDALFACNGSVLVISYTAPDNFTHKSIPLPLNVRAYEVIGSGKFSTFFGVSYGAPPDYLSIGIHFFDPAAGEARLVVNATTEGEVINAVLDPAGDLLAVLTAGENGTLITLNPRTGAEMRRVTGVLSGDLSTAFDTSDDVWPAVQVGLGRLFVMIPKKAAVEEYHQDTLEVLRTFNVGGAPSSAVVLGPIKYWDNFAQH